MNDKIVACYSCGKVNGKYSRNEETELLICKECHSPTVLSIQEMMDICNEYLSIKTSPFLKELHREYEETF